MFGFSFAELVVVVIVALIVMGPKDLPKMLRKLGQWSGQLRRMAADLRAQSGIDDALRAEGLSEDIAEIRKLARGELDSVQRSVDDGIRSTPTTDATASSYLGDFYVVREREYPRDGADGYGALPDNAIVYAEGLPKSKLGRDPLYVLGDPNGVLPPEPVHTDDGELEGEAGEAGETSEANGAASEADAPEPTAEPSDAPVPRTSPSEAG